MKKILTLVIILAGTMGLCQQTDSVDFLRVKAQIEPVPSDEKVMGNVMYTFKVLRATDSIYLDAINMRITNAALEGVHVSASEKKIWLLNSFEAGREYTAFFSYEATPSQALYFTGEQIWTQGQGKYTSHWLPSIDDMNDKIEFDLTILADTSKTVIANGNLLLVDRSKNKNHWQFDMQEKMSSYLVAFVIGDFEKQSISSASGVMIDLYSKPEDAANVEPTYRNTREIFDFLESEIGVPYPWINYKQVPLRDFLYAGMENTTVTFFSEAFVVDSIGFNDRNYVNVNAHELAHHWFGNLVTETEGTHHWLHEGFATYYALLAEKELFGEDYYYWKLFQSAEQLKALSDEGKGESLLNPKASSLTFYEKGAWALHILKEQIGEDSFRKGIKNYLEKFRFKNVTTKDFLDEMSAAAGQDLAEFEAEWLQQSAFKAEAAYESLVHSDFMLEYFEVAALRQIPFQNKKRELLTTLTFPGDYKGQEAILQLAGEPISESLPMYKRGFDSNNLYVRQAIALSMDSIPKQLQQEFESLLDDASYVTKEAALYTLWLNFPEKREIYLKKTEKLIGFQDKSLRQLWLVLAILDSNYKVNKREAYTNELKSYTSEAYSFEIRKIAFGYVDELRLWDELTLKNLVNASGNPAWRFRNYVRKLLEKVLKNETFRTEILNEMAIFSEKEKTFLESILYRE